MNLLNVPPGILDLVPWKPRRHVHHRQAAACDLTPRVWSQLPESLLHSILARLPFQSILRFRCVCRQWKALFESSSFNALFACHRNDFHPWIFFIGYTHRSARARARLAYPQYDDGRDDDGFVYEGHGQFDHIYVTESDSSIDGHDVQQHEDPGDMDDASSSDEDGDLHGGTYSGDQQDGLHDDVKDDHGGLHYALGSDDVSDGDVNGITHHGGQQDGIVTNQWYPYNVGGQVANHWYPFLDADDVVHVKKKCKKERGELFLIFDCKSESWRRAIAIAPGFKSSSPKNFLCRYDVCSIQEQVLVVTGSLNRFFVFNPASPPGKELPPCICTKEVEGLVLAERTSGMSSSITRLSSVLKDKRATEQVEGNNTVLKDLVVVVIGDTRLGNNVVESFDFVTGAWHVCGYIELFENEPLVLQRRMVYCKGSIYVMAVGRMLIFNNYLAGQNFEWTSWDFPTPPNENEDEQRVEMAEMRLLGTKDYVLVVGITETSPPYGTSNWNSVLESDVGIWKFCPHVPQDACWQFVAYTPKSILDGFYGDTHTSSIDAFAHGDLVFFHVPESQRFVIYNMAQKLWKFSAKCKHFLSSLTYVWEPLLRK